MITPSSMLSPAFFDSCAFDGGDVTEQQASLEIREQFGIHGLRLAKKNIMWAYLWYQLGLEIKKYSINK